MKFRVSVLVLFCVSILSYRYRTIEAASSLKILKKIARLLRRMPIESITEKLKIQVHKYIKKVDKWRRAHCKEKVTDHSHIHRGKSKRFKGLKCGLYECSEDGVLQRNLCYVKVNGSTDGCEEEMEKNLDKYYPECCTALECYLKTTIPKFKNYTTAIKQLDHVIINVNQ